MAEEEMERRMEGVEAPELTAEEGMEEEVAAEEEREEGVSARGESGGDLLLCSTGEAVVCRREGGGNARVGVAVPLLEDGREEEGEGAVADDIANERESLLDRRPTQQQNDGFSRESRVEL